MFHRHHQTWTVIIVVMAHVVWGDLMIMMVSLQLIIPYWKFHLLTYFIKSLFQNAFHPQLNISTLFTDSPASSSAWQSLHLSSTPARSVSRWSRPRNQFWPAPRVEGSYGLQNGKPILLPFLKKKTIWSIELAHHQRQRPVSSLPRISGEIWHIITSLRCWKQLHQNGNMLRL